MRRSQCDKMLGKGIMRASEREIECVLVGMGEEQCDQ